MYGPYLYLLIPVIIFSFFASSKVKRNYKKFAKVKSMRGLTGFEVAEEILQRNKLSHIRIERGSGVMSDHYNPSSKTIVLSPHVYDTNSVSAVSIAAHECGHAVQHANAYGPLAVRSLIAPAASFVSKYISFVIIAGLLFARSGGIVLIDIGIIAYLLIAIFQVVTLPVEFNASNRAMLMLEEYGLLFEEDMHGTKKVLNAAALTYVAAMLASVMTLVRLILIRNRR